MSKKESVSSSNLDSSNQLKNNITNPQLVENIDTSWMNLPQKKYYEVLRNPENHHKKRKEISALAGYKSDTSWYQIIKDVRFVRLLENMGVPIKLHHRDYQAHHEVEYIKNPNEQEKYLKQNVWDMRKISKTYPQHINPSLFTVRFTKIENIHFRELVKKFFVNMLGNWEALSFEYNLRYVYEFLNLVNDFFPQIKSFKELERQHMEKVLPVINSRFSNVKVRKVLSAVRSMFYYMYSNKWPNGPQTPTLLNRYDAPKTEETLPRPIPPHIKVQLDDYIENTIIPLLEAGEDTPIISPVNWDLIIIIRHTGRRIEDIAHLIADDSDNDCLKYDLDGDPQLYIDHRIAKIKKDLVVPLAHIKDSQGRNIVERSILRQKERVKDLPSTKSDNNRYLFREIIAYDKHNIPITEVFSYWKFNNVLLLKISEQIPLSNMGAESGDIYKISSHQFRHTVATEMIDAGVDIYAVKNFLGHSSVAMTEKYIKVYQQRLKKEFKEKLLKSDATVIKDNLPEQEEIFGDNKWVKNKIIAIFDQGDGCCEHPYKMPSCPHQMACKTCIKKKILPRHKNAVMDTIDAFTTHLNQAKQIGLDEKIEEFEKIVRFHETALEIIKKGETFDAAKHFYIGGVH